MQQPPLWLRLSVGVKAPPELQRALLYQSLLCGPASRKCRLKAIVFLLVSPPFSAPGPAGARLHMGQTKL